MTDNASRDAASRTLPAGYSGLRTLQSEDLMREVTLRLRALTKVTWFRVHVVNYESIHEHDAYAQVEEGR